MTTYGVLGVGSIATSIVLGLCEGVVDPPEVVLSPRGAQRATGLASRLATVRVASDNQSVIDACDVLVICLLPDDAPKVLSGLRFRSNLAVVSAVAGLHVAQLKHLTAPASDVARSIPLPAVARRETVTPVHPGTRSATDLFDRLGGSMVIAEEPGFESLSAASATVAAYFRYLGTVAEWLSVHLDPTNARRFVAQTFAALASELEVPEPDFSLLARAHSTPGGLNEQFAMHLEESGGYDAIRSGLDAVLSRIEPR